MITEPLTPTPFLRPTDEEGVYEVHLDNSAKEQFEMCKRSSEYYNRWRRESVGEKASLFRGTVCHHAVAIRRNSHLAGVPQAIWEPEQVGYILGAYEGKDFGPDEWRTAEHCVDTILLYNKQWPVDSEPFTVVPGSVESPFKLLLGEAHLDSWVETFAGKFYVKLVRIFWTGILDCRIEYGVSLGLDSKTTSILGTQFWDNFQLDSQMLGYTWSCHKLGFPVQGMYVDAIAGRKPTKSGKAHEYQRQRFFYEQAQLDEWEHDTFTHVEDFLENLCRNYFPKSPKWCFGKYGRCQYWDVCSQSPEVRMSILNSDLYRNVTWNPLEAHKQHERSIHQGNNGKSQTATPPEVANTGTGQ